LPAVVLALILNHDFEPLEVNLELYKPKKKVQDLTKLMNLIDPMDVLNLFGVSSYPSTTVYGQ